MELETLTSGDRRKREVTGKFRKEKDRRERIAFEYWLELPEPRTIGDLRRKYEQLRMDLPPSATLYRWRTGWQKEAERLEAQLLKQMITKGVIAEKTKEQVIEPEEIDLLTVKSHQVTYEEVTTVGGEGLCMALAALSEKTVEAVRRFDVPHRVTAKDLLALSSVYKNFASTAQTFHNLRMEVEGLGFVLEEIGALVDANAKN